MAVSVIDQVRRFNRAVAEGIGVLDGHFLGLKRPVGEARVLWEIGKDGSEVRALRTRLGLDSGYLSRVLRSLERQQLARVRTSRADERVRYAHLTRAGQAERRELDRRSDALASRILEPLNPRQRDSLLAAMSAVERLIEASMITFAIEDAAGDDARWCFEQYFAELDVRFDEGFDPQLTLPITVADMTAPAGALIVARLRGRPIGCGAVKISRKAPAHIRRMWVSPTVRGLGVGRRLLQEIERAAWSLGARRVRLDTHRSLTEAIAMYRASGYREAAPASGERYADFWFEKRLTPKSPAPSSRLRSVRRDTRRAGRSHAAARSS